MTLHDLPCPPLSTLVGAWQVALARRAAERPLLVVDRVTVYRVGTSAEASPPSALVSSGDVTAGTSAGGVAQGWGSARSDKSGIVSGSGRPSLTPVVERARIELRPHDGHLVVYAPRRRASHLRRSREKAQRERRNESGAPSSSNETSPGAPPKFLKLGSVVKLQQMQQEVGRALRFGGGQLSGGCAPRPLLLMPVATWHAPF